MSDSLWRALSASEREEYASLQYEFYGDETQNRLRELEDIARLRLLEQGADVSDTQPSVEVVES